MAHVKLISFAPEQAVSSDQISAPQAGQPWVFFDADNTLWHIEHLYDDARRALVERLARDGFDPADVEATQRRFDRSAFGELGYSSQRFPLSFVRTLLSFKPDADITEQTLVRRIGEEALTSPALVDPDTVVVLNALKRNFRLGLVTAGDEVVQQRRLQGFPQACLFDRIWITHQKSADVFDTICRQVGADRGRSWVVGDSIQSDAIPAHTVGLNTVLVRNPNWHEIELQGEAPKTTIVIQKLRDVVKIISSSDGDRQRRGSSLS